MNRLRQEEIKDYVESKKIVTIKELCARFSGVSLMTIHRDLDALESQGVLVKYRGGVKSVKHMDDVEFNVRLKENHIGKTLMARKALELLQPHSSIFLDAGTSNLFLAKEISDINLNIITTSPGIALELAKLKNPVITLCPGTLNRNNLALSGQRTIEMLEDINIDVAFIGVSGSSLAAGFTCGTEADSFVKRKLIKRARTSVLMCSIDKLKCLMPYTFATMADIDYIICDEEMPAEYIRLAEENNVIIL